MIEILVFETSEEAEKALEKYEQQNREAHDGLVKLPREKFSERFSEMISRQRYHFVAELAAYADDGPGKYYYVSQQFPFLGFTEMYDDIPSLVQGIKDAVKHQTPRNIETILYTVKDHSAGNKEMKEKAEESINFAEDLPPDGVYGISKQELQDFLQEFGKVAGAEERGLTEQERKEFVKFYEK